MKRHGFSQLCMTVLGILGAGAAPDLVRALQPPRPAGEDELQVLARGPVHEAFAGTVTFDPEPSIVVTTAPPNPIEEIPPDQKPEGANVAWIPGYTAWDDERNDYLWVTGVWRAPPPGRQWVSGYWGQSSQGYQWTAGYWGDAQSTEVEYLPEPPENVEVGPGVPAPSSNHSWIPGCWVWHQGRYVWRPGYWVSAHSDWDWIPGHYTWAPCGYVFVDGYWDHSITRRGVMFAPVHFNAEVYNRRDYYYSPTTVISLNVFSDHLFVRPRYHHYYFGDYYDARYRDAGFHSRSSFQSSRYGYDPIYTRQRWEHRDDRDWEVRVDADFRYRRDHIEARPPRTLSAQITLDASGRTSTERSLRVAASLDQFANSKESHIRFQAVNSAERQNLVQRGRDLRKFRLERQLLETGSESASPDQFAARAGPVKRVLPRSAIVARRIEELSNDLAPPKRPQAPHPDPRVEARPRRAGGRSDASRADDRERSDRASEKEEKDKSKKKSKDD